MSDRLPCTDKGKSDFPCYRREDSVGPFRHLVIIAVDAAVLLIALTLYLAVTDWVVTLLSSPGSTLDMFLVLVLPLLGTWCYLAVLKPSRFRTVGYRVADARIITLDGQSPSPLLMTRRLLWVVLWLMLPIVFVVDLFWTFIDDERQMLRDLFAGTRLVRHSANPVGIGRRASAFYTALGLTVAYTQIRCMEGIDVELSERGDGDGETQESQNMAPPRRELQALSVVVCPACGMRVVPRADGMCPSCQTELAGNE